MDVREPMGRPIATDPTSSHESFTLRRAFAHAAWWGIGAGGLEVGYALFRKYARALFLFQPPEIAWMSPVANAAVFALAIALVYLVAGAVRRRPRPAPVVGALVALAAVNTLLLFPPLHPGAALLLATGFGAMATRLRIGERSWYRALVRRSLPVFGLAILGVGVTQAVVARRRERAAVSGLPSAEAGLPNVLLIVLDTVRAWNLGLYGYPRPTTSALTRWAQTAVRFDRAIAPAPWTLPSHASMFTGREAHELAADWLVPLEPAVPTLAEYLARSGYVTGGFVANTFYASRETGLDRGFTRYEDYSFTLGQVALASSIVRAASLNKTIRSIVGTQELLNRKPAPAVSRSFLHWLDRRPNRPFFAFLNYYDAHTPFVPPEPFASRFTTPGGRLVADLDRRWSKPAPWDPALIQGGVDAYDASIAFLDAELGKLFDTLSARKLLDSTIVIVTSDHGEEFAEHGVVHHGKSLYFPSLHVPLLISWPGHIPTNASVQRWVTLRDLPSTVVHLTGLDRGSPFPGIPLIHRSGELVDSSTAPIFASVRFAPRLPDWYPSSSGDMVSALRGNLRVIRNGVGHFEAYDLSRDSLEQADLMRDSTRQAEIRSLTAMLDSVARARR